MAWTASLPSVVTGNPTKASDYNNLLNNVLFRRDTTTGDVSQMIIAAGSDGSAAAPAIKRNADATGFYFAAGTVYLSCAGVLQGTFSSGGLVLPTGLNVTGWTGTNGLIVTGNISTSLTVSGLYLGTLTSTAAYANGISMGAVTASASNQIAMGINMGSVTGWSSTYGIGTGTISANVNDAFGCTVRGISMGNVSATSSYVGGSAWSAGLFLPSVTSNCSAGTGSNTSTAYGINISAVSAAGSSGGSVTTAYGIYITGIASTGPGTATNYGIYVNTACHNYFAGSVRVAGDISPFTGATGVQFTGTSVAPTLTNAQTIKTAAAAGSQAGWIKIYVGTTAQYVPYWSAT